MLAISTSLPKFEKGCWKKIMNGYVEAGYLVVLGVLAGYSALLVGRSRRMKKVLLPVKAKEVRDESRPTQ